MDHPSNRSTDEPRPPLSLACEAIFLSELQYLAYEGRKLMDRVRVAASKWIEANQAFEVGSGVEGLLSSGEAQADLFTTVEAFLTVWARASLILHPAPRTHKERAKARGRYLREVLGIGDDHPIRDRKLRDHWMHFDERIDQDTGASVRRTPQKFVPVGQAEEERGRVMRLFVPGNLTVYMLGEEFRLDELDRALTEIGSLAEAARASQFERRRSEYEVAANESSY